MYGKGTAPCAVCSGDTVQVHISQPVELQMKVKQSCAKISQSWRRPPARTRIICNTIYVKAGIDVLLITLQMRVATRDTNLVSDPPAVKLFSCYLSWDLDTDISLVRIQGDHCMVTVLITVHLLY